MKTLAICFAVVYLFFYLYFAINSKNFKKSILQSVLFGLISLVVLHVIGGHLGFKVPLNIYTLVFSAITGLPGILLILLLGFIII